jgi:hypothetical protein
MRNSRVDAIFFGLLLVVFTAGYFLSNRPADDEVTLVVSDFALPELVFEIPFEFPYAIMEFESRVAPTLMLSGGMESALGEVRSALLESSAIREIEPREEWVAALE